MAGRKGGGVVIGVRHRNNLLKESDLLFGCFVPLFQYFHHLR